MMSEWQLAAGAFVVGLSGAMSPGPVLAATIAESLRRGFWAGPLIVLGHAILELVLLACLMAGAGALLRLDPVRFTIALAGGGMLLLTGARMLAALGRLDATSGSVSTSAPGAGWHPVIAGILLSLSNPYWILWWATVGLAFLTPTMARGPIAVAAFYAGHTGADLAWYSIVSASVAKGRRFLPPRGWR